MSHHVKAPRAAHRKNSHYGIVMILLGATCALVSIVISDTALTQDDRHTDGIEATKAIASEPPRTAAKLAEVFVKFVEHIGVALMVVGFVGFFLEFKDWELYFQKRIAETIVQKPFLRQLTDDELKAVQIETSKAFFKIDDLDDKDGFLRYFQTRLHSYLGSPFRESVECIITVKSMADDYVEFVDTVSYKCRTVGGRIQDHVRWTYSGTEDSYLDPPTFKLEIAVPDLVYNQPDFRAECPGVEQTQALSPPNPKLEPIKTDGRLGYQHSLQQYSTIDGLFIKVTTSYKVPRERINFWTMTHLSRNVRVTIAYPPVCSIQVVRFGLTHSEVRIDSRRGLYNCSFDSWVLPDTGIAFILFDAPDGDASV